MEKQSRRRFLATAGAAAALPLVEAAPNVDAGEPPASVDQALLAIVRLRYKHLTEDQLKAVQRSVQNGQAAAEILKRVRMEAVDEPATIFVADLAE